MSTPPQPEVCLDCAPACDLPQPSSSSSTAQPSNGQTVESTDEHVKAQDELEDVMKPETFVPPSLRVGPSVYIEYCDRCRWAPRASWISTELFLTFPCPTLGSITLIPSTETAGRFRVWLGNLPNDGEGLDLGEGMVRKENGMVLVWDRKVEGAFPELKLLKQRIRNIIQPKQDLGHSDKQGSKTVEG